MTRFPTLHALLTGEPTPAERLLREVEQTRAEIDKATDNHAKVIPLRSKLKSLTHLRLVEGI